MSRRQWTYADMTSNVVNQTPYLRTSVRFPEEPKEMIRELSKSYIDIAGAVNARTIGIFPSNNPAITGNVWYFDGLKHQTLRKIFPFGPIAMGTSLNIPLGFDNFQTIVNIYGTVQTQTTYRPLPYIDPSSLSNGMAILVQPIGPNSILNVTIKLGSTAPPVVSGFAVIEFLSAV
jgi:hypothetical protein